MPGSDKIHIDLNGTDGNAFMLLGLAKRLSGQLGHNKEQSDEIIGQMKSGDYKNLIKVLDDNFGEFVILHW